MAATVLACVAVFTHSDVARAGQRSIETLHPGTAVTIMQGQAYGQRHPTYSTTDDQLLSKAIVGAWIFVLPYDYIVNHAPVIVLVFPWLSGY